MTTWNPDAASIFLTSGEAASLTGIGARALWLRQVSGEIIQHRLKSPNSSHWRRMYLLADVLALKNGGNGTGARAAATSRQAQG